MNDRYYSIGQVVERLENEFPEITVSKIRFLESAGLLKPKRRKSGYRLFSEEDISQLRKILILQKEYYLPLSIIKEKLESQESLPIETPQPETYESETPKNMNEITQETGISADFVLDLENYGLIEAINTPDGKKFSPQDLSIIQTAHNLLSFGIEPRHLRVYENFISKEALTFEQIIFPITRHKTHDVRDTVKKTYDTLLRCSLALQTSLLKKILKKRFPDIDF